MAKKDKTNGGDAKTKTKFNPPDPNIAKLNAIMNDVAEKYSPKKNWKLFVKTVAAEAHVAGIDASQYDTQALTFAKEYEE